MKAATLADNVRSAYVGFQSTPPVKAATFQQRKGFIGLRISIHAAREGGDQQGREFPSTVTISIHAAREGGDQLPSLPLAQQ